VPDTTFTDAELNAKFSKLTGDVTPVSMRFFAFKAYAETLS
jgi:hypothetical protein